MPDINNKSKRIPHVNLSPCIRNCCLNEVDICLGCFRHLDEITGWRELTEAEQLNVLAKCEQRKKSNNQ